jgi:tryptophanyl-tRNA synthetase
MTRVFSGIQPSGDLHLGNYVGALRRFVDLQHRADAVFCIVDLHAMTLPHDAATLTDRTVEMAMTYLAAGIDPDVSTLFVQSHVHEHAELTWLMECNVGFGELSRMVAFKEKAARGEFTSAALFTYPALQAADILLYDTDQVPVGDDQRQHVELTRDVAIRFNGRYGETFVVPEHAIPEVGARVMDLQNPTAKMSKSVLSPQGTVNLLEDLKAVEKKIKRAVTDTETEVRYDPEAKPGVSNLLEIFAVATGEDPAAIATRYTQYGPLKADAAEAVVELLRPIQARYAELAADRAGVTATLAKGAEKARAIAAVTLDRARRAVGLLPR